MSNQSKVFLTGALCHPDILRQVVGPTRLTPALLQGFAGDASVPGLWHEPQSDVRGSVLHIANDEMRDRLDFYGAVFGAEPAQVKVTLADGAAVTAQIYVVGQQDARFALPDSAHPEAVYIRMAGEIMLSFNMLPAEFVADRLSGILRRATSFVATQSMPTDPDRDITRDVVIKARAQPYMNFFTVEENDLRFRRYDGQLSEVINRGALHVGQVVAVLPYDPVRDCVLLVEQFRAAVLMSGNAAPWMWQPVAGLIDPGETPVAAAHREAEEEAGLTISRLEDAGQAYSSPGSSTEFVYLYVGIADLGATQTHGGLIEEDEDIRSQVLSFDALMQALDSNQFHDLPLFSLALWLARHRDRLRLMA